MRGASNLVLGYIQKHPDRIVTLQEIASALNMPNESVSNAMVVLRRQHPDNVVSVKQGQYMFKSAAPEIKREFIVRVVEEDATRLLVMDDETSTLFVMKKLEW